MLLRKSYPLYILFCIWCFLISCNKNHHSVTRGFYYWKTTYRPTAYEINRLRQLRVSKMYVRMFDVVWDYGNRRAIPVASIRLRGSMDSQFRYIPVVFITQGVLVNSHDSSIQKLAQDIGSL